jgi:hypothetical protein
LLKETELKKKTLTLCSNLAVVEGEGVDVDEDVDQ